MLNRLWPSRTGMLDPSGRMIGSSMTDRFEHRGQKDLALVATQRRINYSRDATHPAFALVDRYYARGRLDLANAACTRSGSISRARCASSRARSIACCAGTAPGQHQDHARGDRSATFSVLIRMLASSAWQPVRGAAPRPIAFTRSRYSGEQRGRRLGFRLRRGERRRVGPRMHLK